MAEEYWVLADTNEGYTYDSYVEYCKEMEKEPQGDESDDFYQYIEDMKEWDMEDLDTNLDHCEIEDVVVSGNLGLWWGNPTINLKYFKTLKEAIQECIKSAWDFNVLFYPRSGYIEVNAFHHDGTNSFLVNQLNYLGMKEYRAERLENKCEIADWMVKKMKAPF